jgi:hypothetical protein
MTTRKNLPKSRKKKNLSEILGVFLIRELAI